MLASASMTMSKGIKLNRIFPAPHNACEHKRNGCNAGDANKETTKGCDTLLDRHLKRTPMASEAGTFGLSGFGIKVRLRG